MSVVPFVVETYHKGHKTIQSTRRLAVCRCGCYLIERHIGRNVVVRHDVLHVARVLINIVAVVLAASIYPLVVVVVEFFLIIGREPRLMIRWVPVSAETIRPLA